jgi:hypothetical protein
MPRRLNAQLHAVGDCVGEAADPTVELAALFAREAQLKRQMADVADALESARKRFTGTRSDGTPQSPPRMELLRTMFGPKPEPRR